MSEIITKPITNTSMSTNLANKPGPVAKEQQSQTSWLLRFFESKHFDMSIAISYLFNTKEPGVQTYLCNRLFTFPSEHVDFYLPQLLNIYIYCCNESNEQIMAEMLNAYFRSRCSCRTTGIDFSLRCSWLLDAHINDNAKLATTSKESRIRRGLNNAIKLYKLIISEKLRPVPQAQNDLSKSKIHSNTTTSLCSNANTLKSSICSTNNNNSNALIMTSLVKEESLNDIANADSDVSSDDSNLNNNLNEQ